MQVAILLGLYDPEDLMVLVVLMVDRDSVWSLCQSSIGESHKKYLRFWSKALPSSLDNFSPFDRQLMACYWALVENEYSQ